MHLLYRQPLQHFPPLPKDVLKFWVSSQLLQDRACRMLSTGRNCTDALETWHSSLLPLAYSGSSLLLSLPSTCWVSVPRISDTFQPCFLVGRFLWLWMLIFPGYWDIAYTEVVHLGHDQGLTFRNEGNEGDNRNGPSVFPSCSKSESECQMSPFDKWDIWVCRSTEQLFHPEYLPTAVIWLAK